MVTDISYAFSQRIFACISAVRDACARADTVY
jgi:hypothetical protein